jgi:hypothetical protein
MPIRSRIRHKSDRGTLSAKTICNRLFKSLYAADVLKINTTLTLNGTEVLPAPEVCAYENGICDENNQLKMGEYYKIDYSNQVDSTLSFRIESIWAG